MDYLNYLSQQMFFMPSILLLIIVTVIGISLIAFFAEMELGFLACLTVLVCAFFIVFLPEHYYTKNITVNTVTETKQIKPLPYQYVNQDTYTFLVDNKEFSTIKTKDTIYKQDGEDKPYMVVEKVTYSAPKKWYIANSVKDKINDKTFYFLKEVHY